MSRVLILPTSVVEHVNHTLAESIKKARMEKEWSQQELAKAINEKWTVVEEYETARAVYNADIVTKMERALGMQLNRGKKNKRNKKKK